LKDCQPKFPKLKIAARKNNGEKKCLKQQKPLEFRSYFAYNVSDLKKGTVNKPVGESAQ
jgi:hypothetical protein